MRRAGGTRHRARRTAAQWRKLIERFDRPGQTRGKFCAGNGWALSTFDLWRRKLQATPTAVEEERGEALFVELAQAQTSPTSTGIGAWEIELEQIALPPLRLGAAVHYPIAIGPHTGRKALTLHTVSANPLASNPCIAQLPGFSLHACPRMGESGTDTCCRARDRGSLERLCRYIARPAVSNERLSVNDHRQVVHRLKHPFGDGTTHVVLDPIEFMRHIRVPHPFGAASGCANRQSCRFGIARLAALVPRPRAHLTRYHGVFAPNFKRRHRIIPNSVHRTAREPHAARRAPMSWMQRLKRLPHQLRTQVRHNPVAPRLPCPSVSTALLTRVHVCRLEIASSRPRFVCSRTDIGPDNDRTILPQPWQSTRHSTYPSRYPSLLAANSG